MFETTNTDYARLGLAKAAPKTVEVTDLDEEELLLLRARIDDLLPATKLADIDLERELMLQLRTAQALQNRTLLTDDIPANQKAQVLNAVAASIQALIKMQAEYYTPERLKRIETHLISLLNSWPEDQTRPFFEAYEKLLAGA